MLLAKHEPQSVGPSWSITVNSYYIIIPSDSSTLLIKAIAVRELLLPCNVPALPADTPEAALSTIEASEAWLHTSLDSTRQISFCTYRIPTH